MSLVGQEIELIKGGTITVAKEKETADGGVIVVSTDGEIYTQDELNLEYRLVPGYILYHALEELGIVDEDSYDGDLYDEAVEAFMDGMVTSGYVNKKEDKEQESEPQEEEKIHLQEDNKAIHENESLLKNLVCTARDIDLIELDDNAYYCYGNTVLGYTYKEVMDYLLEEEHEDMLNEIEKRVRQYLRTQG